MARKRQGRGGREAAEKSESLDVGAEPERGEGEVSL
jgi:hypothetical protein